MFTPEQSEKLFPLLSKNPSQGYQLSDLISRINRYINSEGKITDGPISGNNMTKSQITVNTHEHAPFLKSLNDTKDISMVTRSLSLGKNNEISMFELFTNFVKTYPKIDKAQLKSVIMGMDKDKAGFVQYEDINDLFYDILDEFRPSLELHCKFLAGEISKQYKGNWKNYISDLELDLNRSLTKEEFGEYFGEDLLNDDFIKDALFNRVKDKKGKNATVLVVSDLVDYLSTFT